MQYLDIIQDSLDYIEDNLKADIKTEDLSRRAGFSLYHYYRLFQLVVGLPVKQYMLWRKLMWIAWEMSQGRSQIDAALDYSFDTSAGLYKAFRRNFGCSPSEYVRKFRIQKPYKIKLLQGAYVMLTHARVQEILSAWDLPGCDIQNVVDTEDGTIHPNVFSIADRYILKIFDLPGTANCSAHILQALYDAGISTNNPIPTKAEETVAADGEFYAILTPKIDGAPLCAGEVFAKPELARYLGMVIGKLHLTLAENDHIVCNERNIFEEVLSCWLKLAREYMGLTQEFCCGYRANFGKLHSSLPVQIIHRDPNPGNILMKDGLCAGFVDFDLTQRSIRLFDPCYAATALLCSAFGEGNADWKEKWGGVLQNILRGYDSVVHLTEEEKQAVPYVIYSIQLICVGYFSGEEKFSQLAKDNAAMLRWLMEHEDVLKFSGA